MACVSMMTYDDKPEAVYGVNFSQGFSETPGDKSLVKTIFPVVKRDGAETTVI